MQKQRTTVQVAAPADRRGIMAPVVDSDDLAEVVRREQELVEADPSTPAGSTGFAAVALAEDVVLLTYRLLGSTGSLRSSVWVRTSGTWRLRFHQGTRSVVTPHARADLLTGS